VSLANFALQKGDPIHDVDAFRLSELDVTEDDLLEAKAIANNWTLEQTIDVSRAADCYLLPPTLTR
jgi:predicted nucleotidyltransferase